VISYNLLCESDVTTVNEATGRLGGLTHGSLSSTARRTRALLRVGSILLSSTNRRLARASDRSSRTGRGLVSTSRRLVSTTRRLVSTTHRLVSTSRRRRARTARRASRRSGSRRSRSLGSLTGSSTSLSLSRGETTGKLLLSGRSRLVLEDGEDIIRASSKSSELITATPSTGANPEDSNSVDLLHGRLDGLSLSKDGSLTVHLSELTLGLLVASNEATSIGTTATVSTLFNVLNHLSVHHLTRRLGGFGLVSSLVTGEARVEEDGVRATSETTVLATTHSTAGNNLNLNTGDSG
jgi:hypothetical protein